MPQRSAKTYWPKTKVEIRLRFDQFRDISTATGIPLGTVQRYAGEILDKSMADTIKTIEPKIYKYAPKATGQLRNSLAKFLRQSQVSHGRILQMKFGTYIKYMKHVANMNSRMTRHPKGIKAGTYKNYTKFPRYQRNSKHGKKGQLKRNPGKWRFVRYYGGPRWVSLNDPEAQTNFYRILIIHIKDELLKNITSEIRSVVPKGQRLQFNTRMRPKFT